MKKLLIPIVLLVISCSDEDKALQQARFNEIMVIHDEVMPYMSTIHSLQKQIKESAKLVATTDSTGNEKAAFAALSSNLDLANESMMNWMRNFSKPSDDKAHLEIMDYYAKELAKISRVKQQMLDAIEKSKQRLGQD